MAQKSGGSADDVFLVLASIGKWISTTETLPTVLLRLQGNTTIRTTLTFVPSCRPKPRQKIGLLPDLIMNYYCKNKINEAILGDLNRA